MVQDLHNPKTICLLTLIILIVIINSGKVFGQDKFRITGGFSTAELLNVGLHYKFKQSQIGFCIGFIPAYSYKSIAISTNFYYHFAGSSKYSDLRPWYGKSGMMYMVDEDEYRLDKGLYLPLLIGRDFNLSKKFGINFELGLGFLLYNDRTTKKIHNSEYGETEAGSFPCFGIGCFYRF